MRELGGCSHLEKGIGVDNNGRTIIGLEVRGECGRRVIDENERLKVDVKKLPCLSVDILRLRVSLV